MATAFVAAIGDVDICCYCAYWHFHEFAHVGGYFPVLGFAGDWVGRVRGGEERGKNHAGIRTKATLILDLVIVDPID